MKLLPIIVASAFVIATSSSYAQDEKSFMNDLETCVGAVFELQKDLARSQKRRAEADGAGRGLAVLVEQLQVENERLAEQNMKLFDAVINFQSAAK